MPTPQRSLLLGSACALFWILTCVRWFDTGTMRPAWILAVPAAFLAVPALVLAILWLRSRWPLLAGPRLDSSEPLLLALTLAFLFRLPFVVRGAAAAVTPDGALSGIVALHIKDGLERLVFVPHVPYSGSLKSHLSAVLGFAMDPARAFALASVVFFLFFLAGLHRLALLASGPRVAFFASLYVAFGPAFLTRYSLSNDGNYVEVLALGTWALWLAARWAMEEHGRPTLALAAGVLLGLGFWCHILAVIHLVAVGLVMLVYGRWRSWTSIVALGVGWVLGYVPGLLWNAGNHWASFQYLVPGGPAEGDGGASLGLLARLAALVTDYWPVLLGYDTGYPPALDRVVLGLAGFAGLLALSGIALAARTAAASRPHAVLLVFLAVNLAMAVMALPHVPSNPRYLLFLMAPLPIFLAELLGQGRRRFLFAGLVAFGALASLAHLPGTIASDARWRELVAGLEQEGVRYCYTDFHLATRINFLSGEKVVCTAKLGPTTTEYFFSYRQAVEKAPDAALIPVNSYAAERLGRRLTELGVTYERRDFLKPVLLRLSRKVDPEELFPHRSFPMR
jgi:hypothetical protein